MVARLVPISICSFRCFFFNYYFLLVYILSSTWSAILTKIKHQHTHKKQLTYRMKTIAWLQSVRGGGGGGGGLGALTKNLNLGRGYPKKKIIRKKKGRGREDKIGRE